MVHKSGHHFDLVNWWLNSRPKEVFGMGKTAFYGDKGAGVEAGWAKVSVLWYEAGRSDQTERLAS